LRKDILPRVIIIVHEMANVVSAEVSETLSAELKAAT